MRFNVTVMKARISVLAVEKESDGQRPEEGGSCDVIDVLMK